MKRLLIYLSALLPLACYPQTVLTLDECVRLAKENNKRIEASEYQLKYSLYEKRSAKALFLPSFSLTGGALFSTSDGSYSSGTGQLPVLDVNGTPTGASALFPGINLAYDFGWIYSAGVKVEQPIYMGGKIKTGYRMTRIGYEIARQNKRLTESEVVVETSRAYADVVRAKELVQVAESYNKLLVELMRMVESAHKHGVKSQNDVLKVQVKLNESELDLRRAENGHRLAMMNLCHYIGRPLTDRIETDNTLPGIGEASKLDADVSSRPEYLMLEQKSELARQHISMAKSEHLPQIGIVGQYGYMNGIELNGKKMFDNWNFLVGVQVSIPIFDFGHRINKIKSAKAKYVQSRAEFEDTHEQLMLEMAQAFNNLDEAFLERELAETAVASADENLRTSRLHYEKGIELLSDYLESQTLWLHARQTLVIARIDCYLRWLEYQKTTGNIN